MLSVKWLVPAGFTTWVQIAKNNKNASQMTTHFGGIFGVEKGY
jgi:hypothetical protein